MKGKIAGTSPIKVSLTEGKAYSWCTCGESKNQPYCDGAHKGTDFKPLRCTPSETKDVHLCTCKQTSNEMGYCDGAHKSLKS